MGTQRGVNGWLAIHRLTCVLLSPLAMCYDHGVPLMPIPFLLEEEEIWDNVTPPLGEVHLALFSILHCVIFC